MTDTIEDVLGASIAAAVPGLPFEDARQIAIDVLVTPKVPRQVRTVTPDDVLTMRLGPSVDYERIGSIVDGSTLTVYRRADGWLYVTIQGVGGWVSERYTAVV